MGRKSTATSVAVLLLGAVLALAGPIAAKASTSCAPIQFIGVRGSGQPAGYGSTISNVLSTLRSGSKVNISSYALNYPASPIPYFGQSGTITSFYASINTGTSNLRTHLSKQIKECPKQTFLIAGYSQGAFVVDRTLHGETDAVLSKVKGVALIGDPIFKDSVTYDTGTFDNGRQGILRDFLPLYANGSELPALLNSETKSYCLRADPICNNGVLNVYRCLREAGTSKCPHEQYIQEGYAAQAGKFLATRTK